MDPGALWIDDQRNPLPYWYLTFLVKSARNSAAPPVAPEAHGV